jgi:hypothetical protein
MATETVTWSFYLFSLVYAKLELRIRRFQEQILRWPHLFSPPIEFLTGLDYSRQNPVSKKYR